MPVHWGAQDSYINKLLSWHSLVSAMLPLGVVSSRALAAAAASKSEGSICPHHFSTSKACHAHPVNELMFLVQLQVASVPGCVSSWLHQCWSPSLQQRSPCGTESYARVVTPTVVHLVDVCHEPPRSCSVCVCMCSHVVVFTRTNVQRPVSP
jgi:hypothetical protein